MHQKTRKKSLFTLLFGVLALTSCMATEPLPNASSRKTPLHFGLFVTPDPATNPISPPERFEGYHVATDFEVTKAEANEEIPVYAICGGIIHYSGFTEGYGGLVTQYCHLQAQDVTVIYGHLAVNSLVKTGLFVGTGETLGILGAAKSADTDGNRKHLHLGIAKGHGNEIRGYVQNESELDLFLDPEEVLK